MTRVAPTVLEPVQIAPRRSQSRAVRLALHAAYDGLCAMCGLALPSSFELDHIIPLALGGEDAPGNWQPLCEPDHARKTKLDVRAIAKAKRIERKADPETRPHSKRPIRSRGFSTSLSRSFSGAVHPRAESINQGGE